MLIISILDESIHNNSTRQEVADFDSPKAFPPVWLCFRRSLRRSRHLRLVWGRLFRRKSATLERVEKPKGNYRRHHDASGTNGKVPIRQLLTSDRESK